MEKNTADFVYVKQITHQLVHTFSKKRFLHYLILNLKEILENHLMAINKTKDFMSEIS